MTDTIEIPVLYKGKELLFPAEVVRYGYVHRIQVEVEGQIVFLEKDEEGSYRVIAHESNTKDVAEDLLREIVSTVETLLK